MCVVPYGPRAAIGPRLTRVAPVQTVIPRLRERSRAVCIDGSDGCWRTLQRVVRAAIGNQYSTAGDFLAQLVVGWVRESCPSLHQAKQHVAGPAGVTAPHAFALCLEATLDRLFGDFPINSGQCNLTGRHSGVLCLA